MKVRIWGCRGSLPSPMRPGDVANKIAQAIHNMPAIDTSDRDAVNAYVAGLAPLQRGTAGGNTTCIEVQARGKTFILDAGTGIRELGLELMQGPCGRGEGELHILFSHPHWDHIQGFPFFAPAFVPGNRITIYGLHDMHAALLHQQLSVYFPVPMSSMAATFQYITLDEGEPYFVGDVRINNICNAHPGASYSYRLEDGESTFVFASDSEYKQLDNGSVQPHIDFFTGADVLIFDSQYTLDEGWVKEDWGHSSAMIGVDIALAAKVKRLVLFHHDPTYSDARLQQIQTKARAYQEEKVARPTCEIIVAYEGLTLNLSPGASSAEDSDEEDSGSLVVSASAFDEQVVKQIAQQLEGRDASSGMSGSVIDLSRVDTLTTASLKLLIKLQQERSPTPLVLAAPSPKALRVIELAGFSNYFAIYPTVEAAFAAVHAHESLELPGYILGGRYQVQRVLARDGLGTSLSVTDIDNAGTFALKIIEPTYGDAALKKLLSYRTALLGMQHENVLRIFDLSCDEHFSYLVEEYRTSRTLDRILQDSIGPLEFQRALEIALSLSQALEYIHAQNLVHGDLKPRNIFIDDQSITVSGLGLGLLQEGQKLLDAPLLRQTPAYLAPEQVLGRAIGPHTDLYALGVISFQLFTGYLPFEGRDQDILLAHIEAEPPVPQDLNATIPTALSDLIVRLLAKNPLHRPASAMEVREGLQAAGLGEGDSPRETTMMG